VDFADLQVLSEQWVEHSYPKDLTGDFFFDFADLAVLASQWNNGNDMVLIPAGTFQMGDSFGEGEYDERPVHTVTLSSFYMSKYETSNSQYCQFLNSALFQGLVTVRNGRVFNAGSETFHSYCDTSSDYSQIVYSNNSFTVRTKGGRDMTNDPMVQVSWYGAVAYCNWLSQQEGLQPCYDFSTWECDFSKNGYHLPTEAQWEYAARGGLSGGRFSWGDTINHDNANYQAWGIVYSYDTSPYTNQTFHPTWNDGIEPYTSPVGSFAPNGYGLYDTAGNVYEWCNDWYGAYDYSSSPQTNPTGSTQDGYRVLRGGCWYFPAHLCRVAYRSSSSPGNRRYFYGFRVCR